jgi:hypothetical protein
LREPQAKGVSLTDYAQEVLAREAGQHASANAGSAAQAESLFELFAPLRGLLTDEEIDACFGRTPSTGRPVDLA